jgi:hypothetical protein
MFSLFRKTKVSKTEVTTIELGNVLLRIAFGSEKSNQTTLQIFKDANETVKQRVLNEVLFLRVFAIDIVITNILGETPQRDGVLGSLYDCIKRITDQSGGPVWEDLRTRVFKYQEAYKTPHHRGPAFQVGKSFAGFCGYEMDAFVMLAGGAEFTGTIATVSDLIKSLHITV